MVTFNRVTDDEAKANWAKYNAARTLPQPERKTEVVNVRAARALGKGFAFRWHDRNWIVPVLPWDNGISILAAWQELKAGGDGELKLASLPKYRQTLLALQTEIWAVTRPAGGLARLARWLGLSSNPFVEATEAELAEIAFFLLTLRTSSSVQFQKVPSAPFQPSATSSMN